MKPAIITVGNVNLDIVLGPQEPWPDPGSEGLMEDSEIRQGGSAGNAALALQGLGCRQRLLANMGNDFIGRWLAERFGELARDWVFCDRPTAFSVGLTHPDGERTFFFSQGHLTSFALDDIAHYLTPEQTARTTILFVGGFLTPRMTPSYGSIFPRLRGGDARIALDTGWPPGGWTADIRAMVWAWLPNCDELLSNEKEICGLAGVNDLDEACTRLVETMPAGGTVVVKQGRRGSSALAKATGPIHVAGRPVDVVDTIGAGDCFNAGYLFARSRGAGTRDALEKGIEVASMAISTSPRRYG